MKIITSIALLSLCACAFWSMNLCAQEQHSEDMPAQEVSDGGVEAVREAQEAVLAPVEKTFKSALKLMKEQAKGHGWKQGWDGKKRRIIAIEAADFKTADPANDKDFFSKRDMAAKKAYLSAKVSIIESINMEMDAIDVVFMPGTDVNRELGKEREALNTKMSIQKEQLVKMLEKVDKAEADALRGATFSDRLNDLMAAAIKKLDKDYDKNKHDEKYNARYAALKAEFDESLKQYNELVAKAEAMQQAVREKQDSVVRTVAKMPIYGSTVIMQAESWDKDNGKYQVAVIFCWSYVLERAARAIATGEEFKVSPSSSKMSVQDWIASQKPATMVGPRQYIDDEGQRWFIGISARNYDDELASSERRKNKGIAELSSQQMAAFCIWADVESVKEARSTMESRGDATKQVDAVVESYAENLTQKIKGKKIRGMTRIFNETVVHPITGTEIYVPVYAIGTTSAKDALELERELYATAVQENRYQRLERGHAAANRDAVNAARNSAKDYQEGYAGQNNAISGKLEERNGKKPATPLPPANNVPAKKTRQSTPGTFSGDTKVNDDF